MEHLLHRPVGGSSILRGKECNKGLLLGLFGLAGGPAGFFARLVVRAVRQPEHPYAGLAVRVERFRGALACGKVGNDDAAAPPVLLRVPALGVAGGFPAPEHSADAALLLLPVCLVLSGQPVPWFSLLFSGGPVFAAVVGKVDVLPRLPAELDAPVPLVRRFERVAVLFAAPAPDCLRRRGALALALAWS